MIKDHTNFNADSYKGYAFVEFFELENATKALTSLNKGEISLRGEILNGNYSTRVEDQISLNNNMTNKNQQSVKYYFIYN